MKQIADHLYTRGKSGNLYCRVRIPQKLLKAYPRKAEIVGSLGTSDLREVKRLLVTELASIYQEFSVKEKTRHPVRPACGTFRVAFDFAHSRAGQLHCQ